MTDPIKSKLNSVLNEISPEDFGVGSEDDMRRQREEEILDTVGGAGTRDRAGARKWLTLKLKNLLSVVEDPEQDYSYVHEYMNLLNWSHSVYGDVERYNSVIRHMKSLIKDYEGKR